MDCAPTMDLGGHELKSRPAEWFRVFIVFLSPSRHTVVQYLKSHQECFLPLILNFHLIILLFQTTYSLLHQGPWQPQEGDQAPEWAWAFCRREKSFVPAKTETIL